MSRINTNVSSLIAQNTLARNEADLQTALTRLSTGLRINVGKDDPAGLIASEALRNDITSIEKAISNSERANQMIATADSAIGQVSDLLNDIRGLVVEAANTGALSEDQIAANQLQVDSSLEAINRIAQTTTFQGMRLLDGSLGFTTTLPSVASVTDARIDQANLGTASSVNVDVDITSAATTAEITNSAGFSAAANANTTVNLGYAIAIEDAGTSGEYIRIAARDITDDVTGINVAFNDDDAATVTATYSDGDSTIYLNADWDDDQSHVGFAPDFDDVISALEANSDFNARFAVTSSAGGTAVGALSGDQGNFAAVGLTLTAETAGADYNGVEVNVTGGTSTAASYDSAQKAVTLTISNNAATDLSSLASTLDTALDGDFAVAVSGDGNTAVDASTTTTTQTINTDNTGGKVLNDSLVMSVAGTTGREVFNFEAGASINQINDAINLVSDSIGVTTSISSGTLSFTASEYGSKSFVDIEVISEGSSGTFASGLSATRATGTDIVATINGVSASGDGNTFGINTATLDLLLTVEDGSDTNFDFEITGGGALFQLGPDVVSNQQARVGIENLNTAKLGGISGRLYELASGGDKALGTNPTDAAKIVDEVIDKVSSLRGRLGAFQRTTLDTNIASLNETMVNLTAAESEIRDADFAAETAALTRAQILVQSSTSVLSIANSNPQNALALIR
jgi:flagellin